MNVAVELGLVFVLVAHHLASVRAALVRLDPRAGAQSEREDDDGNELAHDPGTMAPGTGRGKGYAPGWRARASA